MISGLIAGGESLFDGVTSGITGLVTKPIQEGKKTGALGFMKGVGMGIAGVAVKPVLGLTDGLSSIASGLNQQINNDNGSTAAQQIRPMRRSVGSELSTVSSVRSLQCECSIIDS